MRCNQVTRPPSLLAAVRTVSRYVLYAIFIAVMSVWLLELIALEAEGKEALAAASRVWWLKCVLTGASGVTLLAGAWQACRGRAWLLLGAGLAGMAFVCEMYSRWEAQLPLAVLVLAMTLLALASVVSLWWGLRRSEPRDMGVLASAAPGILWAGWLLVLVFAPVAGQTQAWRELMGGLDSGDLEWAVSAMIRTLGYMLLWLGAVELVLEATRPERVDRLEKPEPLS